MRKLFLLIFIPFTSLSMANSTYTPKQVDEMGWVIADSQTETYPFQIRFRKVPADFKKNKYPYLIRVFWKMSKPKPNGLASPEELEPMQAFENRFIDATEPKEIAILTAVLTGRGEREFVIYTQSKDKFIDALTHMPQEQDRYPIEIDAEDDSSWSYYHNEVDHIK
jgi:hypothetical protein